LDADTVQPEIVVKKTVKQGIVSFLAEKSQGLTPAEIASGARLNTNSVRREVQQMAKDGLKDTHTACQKPKPTNKTLAEHVHDKRNLSR